MLHQLLQPSISYYSSPSHTTAYNHILYWYNYTAPYRTIPYHSAPPGNIPHYPVLPRSISHHSQLPRTTANHPMPFRTAAHHSTPFGIIRKCSTTLYYFALSNTVSPTQSNSPLFHKNNASFRAIQLHSAPSRQSNTISRDFAQTSNTKHNCTHSRAIPHYFPYNLAPTRAIARHAGHSRSMMQRSDHVSFRIFTCYATHPCMYQRIYLPTNKRNDQPTYPPSNQPILSSSHQPSFSQRYLLRLQSWQP